MESVILVIHLMLALAIIGLVLLQKSEGGGLGIGGSGGGLGGLATAQGASNMASRLTAIFATAFFITSLTLGILASQKAEKTGLIDAVSQIEQSAEQEAPAITAPEPETKDQPAKAPAAPVSTE